MKDKHPLKESILYASRVFCDNTSTDEELISSLEDLKDNSYFDSINEEEKYTINSSLEVLRLFLAEDSFNKLDQLCELAKEKNFSQSYIDLQLFKGYLLSSFSMAGINRGYRIKEKEKMFDSLKEFNVEDYIYFKVILAKHLFIKGEEEESATICEQVLQEIHPEDSTSKAIVLDLLTGTYEDKPDTHVKYIKLGMEVEGYFWVFALQYIDYLTQRGKYLELLQEGKDFLKKIQESQNQKLLGKKMSILDHMIKAAFKLNEQRLMSEYQNEFEQSLNSLPEDNIGLKSYYVLLKTTHKILYGSIFEKEFRIKNLDEVFQTHGSNHYRAMIVSFLILNPIINRMLQDQEFEEAFTLIKQLDKGKGYINATDNILVFLENYYLSLIIDKTLNWQKFNIKNREGNQTEVALSYLEFARENLGDLDYSFKIASFLQELILKMRLGKIEKILNPLQAGTEEAQGFDRLLALNVSLIYHASKESSVKIKPIKEALTIELERYKNLNSYEFWKKNIDDLLSIFAVEKSISPRKKQIPLELDEIRNYAYLLQNQLNKQLIS